MKLPIPNERVGEVQAWLATSDGETARFLAEALATAIKAEPRSVTAVLAAPKDAQADDDEPALPVPTCPECGCQTFSYEESTWQFWPFEQSVPDNNGGGHVTVYSIGWDGIGDGDGKPGLVCDPVRGGGCGVGIELPEGWWLAWD